MTGWKQWAPLFQLITNWPFVKWNICISSILMNEIYMWLGDVAWNWNPCHEEHKNSVTWSAHLHVKSTPKPNPINLHQIRYVPKNLDTASPQSSFELQKCNSSISNLSLSFIEEFDTVKNINWSNTN